MLKLKYGSYTFSGPIPDISLSTNIDTTSAGSPIGSTINIDIKGLIFSEGILNDNSNYNTSLVNNTNGAIFAFTGLLATISGMIDAFSFDYLPLELTCNNIAILPEDFDRNSASINRLNFSPSSNDPNILRSIEYQIGMTVQGGANNIGHAYLSGLQGSIANIQNSYQIQNLDTLQYYGHKGPSTLMYPEFSGQYLPVYQITRTLGATCYETNGYPAIVNAKRCVSGLIEKDINFDSVLSDLRIFDSNTTVENDIENGTYSITKTYNAIKNIADADLVDYTESFTINHNISEDGKRSITINGTIQGLGVAKDLSWDQYKNIDYSMQPISYDMTKSKYMCASGAFDLIRPLLYNRAVLSTFPSGAIKKFDGINLGSGHINPIPLSMSVDHDINNGSITYSYNYDNRTLNLVSGAYQENLIVEDTYGVRTYAQMGIIGRRPLFQDMGSYSSFTRTVSYDATFEKKECGQQQVPATLPQPTLNSIENVLNEFDPQKLQSTFISKLTKDDSNLEMLKGSFRKSKTWIYQKKS